MNRRFLVAYCKYDLCSKSPDHEHCFHTHRGTMVYDMVETVRDKIAKIYPGVATKPLELNFQYDRCCWCFYERYDDE